MKQQKKGTQYLPSLALIEDPVLFGRLSSSIKTKPEKLNVPFFGPTQLWLVERLF